MIKIKYQGGLTKFIACEVGKRNKKRFSKFIHQNLLSGKAIRMSRGAVQIEVVSFSSSRDFYDQILSILSFLRYVGMPISWILYSDGSHTRKQIQILQSCFEFLKIEMKGFENAENLLKTSLLPYKNQLLDYAGKFPLGKKLLYYLNHVITVPTLFLDADILFYNKASIFDVIIADDANGWYLPDGDWGCLDSRYIEQNSRQLYQVNSGLFLMKHEFENLKEGLDFLKNMNYKYEYFSEQNIFHIILRANGFMPLDPRIFILNSSDQFDFSYLYSRNKIAARHYTGPVRHKMWQKDWKWQLSLS